jgi:PDZ domain
LTRANLRTRTKLRAIDGVAVPRLWPEAMSAGQVAGSGSEGVVVTDVDPNGLASDQGVKTGDIILEVGGKKVATPFDVRSGLKDAQKEKQAYDPHASEVGRRDEVRRSAARSGLSKNGANRRHPPPPRFEPGDGCHTRPHPSNSRSGHPSPRRCGVGEGWRVSSPPLAFLGLGRLPGSMVWAKCAHD